MYYNNVRFKNVRYYNNENTLILIEYVNKDNQNIVEIMEVNPSDEKFKELIERVNLDLIAQQTKEHLLQIERTKLELDSFLNKNNFTNEQLEKISNNDFGLVEVLDVDKLWSKFSDEQLFKLKIKIFEDRKVLDSINSPIKAQIRKSSNQFEIIFLYYKLISENDQ